MLHWKDKIKLRSNHHNIHKLYDYAARLITGTSKFQHITPILHELHWLPVSERIKFKIMLFVWKCIHSSAPGYLNNLLTFYHRDSRLRKLHDSTTLTTPICNKSIGQGAFGYSGPHLWNKLPQEIRQSDSVTTFRKCLKTELFRAH